MQSTPGPDRRQGAKPVVASQKGKLIIPPPVRRAAAFRRPHITPKHRIRLLDHPPMPIYERSGGQNCVYGPHYHDPWRPQWMQHRTCGGWFLASVAELKAAGDANICPHCNPPTDLEKFGALENLYHFIDAAADWIRIFILMSAAVSGAFTSVFA